MPPSTLSSKECYRIASQLSQLATSSCRDLPPPSCQLPIFFGHNHHSMWRFDENDMQKTGGHGLTILLHHVTEDSRLPVLLIQAVVREEFAKLGLRSIHSVSHPNLQISPLSPAGWAGYLVYHPDKNPAVWSMPDNWPICSHCLHVVM